MHTPYASLRLDLQVGEDPIALGLLGLRFEVVKAHTVLNKTFSEPDL